MGNPYTRNRLGHTRRSFWDGVIPKYCIGGRSIVGGLGGELSSTWHLSVGELMDGVGDDERSCAGDGGVDCSDISGE